jgi:hypothetical protein
MQTRKRPPAKQHIPLPQVPGCGWVLLNYDLCAVLSKADIRSFFLADL